MKFKYMTAQCRICNRFVISFLLGWQSECSHLRYGKGKLPVRIIKEKYHEVKYHEV